MDAEPPDDNAPRDNVPSPRPGRLARLWSHPRFAKARPTLIDSLVPLTCFYVLHTWLGYSEIIALGVGAVFTAVRITSTLITQRKADGFQLFVLAMTVLSLVVAVLAEDPRIVLLRPSMTSLVLGIGLLITTFVGTPLLEMVLRPGLVLVNPNIGNAWGECWDTNPEFRRRVRILNFAQGVSLLLGAVGRTYVVYHTSIGVALYAGMIPGAALSVVMIPVFMIYGTPVFEALRATRLHDEEQHAHGEPEAAVNLNM